ncbi:MAG: FAD-dependent oxidoreductase [Gammaproteobacteria bacterium]|nr:MAG: FAD-dependent oxidoreductase [Gammaproteobacteria bacterium]
MTQSIIVVGAGWAGLSAAVALTRKRYRVTLLESSRIIGGRARSISQQNQMLDNGQHLLLGAYTQTLSLMRQVGLEEQDCLRRVPLSLDIRVSDGKPGVNVTFGRQTYPWNAVTALMQAKGLTLRERVWFIRGCLALNRHAQQDRSTSDETLQHFLRHQPARLLRLVWAPLCLAAMNTPIETASTTIFARVIRDAFFVSAPHSDMLFPSTGLSEGLPQQICSRLAQHGSRVCPQWRVSSIHYSEGQIQAIEGRRGILPCSALVLAVPPNEVQRLCANLPEMKSLLKQLEGFTWHAIATVYVRYPETVTLPENRLIQGTAGGVIQWIIDRRCCQQPGWMACVISATDVMCPELANSREEMAKSVMQELAQLYPDWPTPLDCRVIQEKRATFASVSGVDRIRPDNRTSLKGLFLAGDYTNTGYPATLEGAVRSGQQAAECME